jgi:uncharacterized membrane protein
VTSVKLPPPAGLGWRTRASLGAALAGGLVFWFVAALPYLLLNQAKLGQYATRRGWILLHIASGTIALLSGPVQLWLGLSDRRLDLHRRIGIVYMAAVAVSSIAAFYLSTHTDGGWVFGAGLFGLGVAWVITTGMAYVAVRRYQIDQHKEWMIRSYVVTFAFVTFRVLFTALQAAQVGALTEQLAIASWFCWAGPLLITEAVLQGRKVLGRA